MKLISSSASHVGRRSEQQDDFGFSTPNDPQFVAHGGRLAVVIDGMGGVAHGRESAQAGKAAFLQTYEQKTPDESVPDQLQRALDEANRAVVSLGQRNGDARSVGATLVGAVVHTLDSRTGVTALQWISVGDSALYLFRAGRLERLNVPHEAIEGTRGPVITSFLGYADSLWLVDRSTQPLTLASGDRVVLCTDGLFKSVPEQEIALELGRAHAADAAQRLVDLAMSRDHPSQDNVTALVMSCEGNGTRAVAEGPDATPTRRPQWPAIVLFGLLGMLLGFAGFCRAVGQTVR